MREAEFIVVDTLGFITWRRSFSELSFSLYRFSILGQSDRVCQICLVLYVHHDAESLLPPDISCQVPHPIDAQF